MIYLFGIINKESTSERSEHSRVDLVKTGDCNSQGPTRVPGSLGSWGHTDPCTLQWRALRK